MNMQNILDLKVPDKIYVGYPTKSELNSLIVIKKAQETDEFSEEDLEYSQVLGMLFVRPCILPLLECQELKSPLYSWDGNIFKELAIIRFEYKQFGQIVDWRMMLDLSIPNQDYLINIVCENDKIIYFSNLGEAGIRFTMAMGLSKLEKYYERKSIWDNTCNI